ncbi:MAG: hypothetical protein RCG15_03070 [Candidatus Rickettsia vulgarisii]
MRKAREENPALFDAIMFEVGEPKIHISKEHFAKLKQESRRMNNSKTQAVYIVGKIVNDLNKKHKIEGKEVKKIFEKLTKAISSLDYRYIDANHDNIKEELTSYLELKGKDNDKKEFTIPSKELDKIEPGKWRSKGNDEFVKAYKIYEKEEMKIFNEKLFKHEIGEKELKNRVASFLNTKNFAEVADRLGIIKNGKINNLMQLRDIAPKEFDANMFRESDVHNVEFRKDERKRIVEEGKSLAPEMLGLKRNHLGKDAARIILVSDKFKVTNPKFMKKGPNNKGSRGL